ncbi:MAG: TetR family transcriptional regulator C-terminal domain-containing protein [Algibacter sp.]|uniref:TetR family transcriptional regulator C-terminal domain-containing protein n=1 Tax=Algibacter sp. TaxID=1872428 RepID=UPI0026100639|nr:TetR family transcriptional regulator C-terminal domain-containing protein [Algibacter sp.]MDG1729792.1 TetR family transcriptional regulator C-terminal domain-containing protein [Algibacter sp.]MDG2177946.1 TetR family transcriptional regulator C-terminal domain-containing protein [Algibacter sp.]
MAKKKTVSKNDIITSYMDYVLEHDQNPKSVFAFAKMNNFEEAKFYEHFASFEAIEKGIFEAFFSNSLDALNKSEDYNIFDARNKLLSFYYTFFENLTANRSYVKHVLDKYNKDLKGLKMLSGLKSHFTSYVSQLGIQMLDIKQEQIEKIQDNALKESAWLQLLLTMKFWIDDTSSSFEKTDIFIEKSVNTTFDVLDISSLKSVLDLGKFLFKEKFQMN